MSYSREDYLYELQQALADLPAGARLDYLAARGVDTDLQREVLARLENLTPTNMGAAAVVIPIGERSKDFGAPAWLASLGYDHLADLGRGGMGVVYKVRDRKRDHVVALKTLEDVSPDSLSRFKREFRALADIGHPNVATLYDVLSDGTRWCFTMEFVDGVDLLTYVRAELSEGASLAEAHETRLRASLSQLGSGLIALHAAGKLHRDIKPTNVLVTPAGRLVMVDFGLAADLGDSGVHRSTKRHVAGTLQYMSPEQIAGEALGPATDWYSVGVMLFEVLTGRLPFDGSFVQLLKRKVEEEAPRPSERTTVPVDLEQLCVGLLQREPAARLRHARLDVVGEQVTDITASLRVRKGPYLVGRQRHLTALTQASESLKTGRPCVTFVTGCSGSGKTALLQRFADTLADDGRSLILKGRCYEQESVPYKALDSAMEELARHLRSLPDLEAAALLPRDVGPLTRVFPVFLTAPAIAQAYASGDSPVPQELRRRAFAALRELLGRLAYRRSVVLALDDLQWGDFDSASLLNDVLGAPDAPAMLVVAAYRQEEEASSPFLRAFLRDGSSADVTSRRVTLEPLSVAEVGELIEELTEGDAAACPAVDVIARESEGNPLFVQELVRAARLGRGLSVAAPRPLSGLASVITARVGMLPSTQRRLLEVLAVSSRPLEEATVCRAAAVDYVDRAAFVALRSARLVRTVLGAGLPMVETYHDRIRESVRLALPQDVRREHHLALAHALEASQDREPETVAVHFHEGGQPERAAQHYAAAGERATSTLAFDRAARFYELALRLGAGTVDELRVRTHLADAFANAGHGGAAATEYLKAAEVPGSDTLDLRCQAATQLLISGRFDDGIQVVHGVLNGIGMQLPPAGSRTILALLLGRLRLRLRGFRFRPRAAEAVPAALLKRVDVSWSVTIGLSMVDPMRGAVFQALNTRLALQAGERYRIARALALEAAHNSAGGTTTSARTRSMLERAAAVTAESGHPHARGMLSLSHGIAAYLETRWQAAIPRMTAAQEVFRRECVGTAWELTTAQFFELAALGFMGHVAQLRSRMPEVLRDAQDRGDLLLAGGVRTLALPLAQMAAGDIAAAHLELETMTARWSQAGFHLQHSNALYRQTELYLYQGDLDAATACAQRLWHGLRAGLLHRVQFMRLNMVYLFSRVAVANAADGRGRSVNLATARRGSRRLRGTGIPYFVGVGQLLDGACGRLDGNPIAAAHALREALDTFTPLDSRLNLAAAQRRLGALIGGTEGDQLVRQSDAVLAAEGAVEAGRLVDVFAPGFRAAS
jgi:eukaryotic-like serine/threonine-protein kinase